MSDAMAYRAFSVIKREGEEDFWLPIGAVFPHRDGKGFNVVLQALPIDGKLVLRLPKDEDGGPPRKERDDDRERRPANGGRGRRDR